MMCEYSPSIYISRGMHRAPDCLCAALPTARSHRLCCVVPNSSAGPTAMVKNGICTLAVNERNLAELDVTGSTNVTDFY